MEESQEEKKETIEEDYDMDKKFFHYREIKCFEGIPPNTIDDGVCESLGR